MSLRCRLGFHDWETINLIIAGDHIEQHSSECRRCGIIHYKVLIPKPPPPPVRYCVSKLCGRPLKGNGSMCMVCWDEADAYTYYPPSGYIEVAKALRQKELLAGDVCLQNSCSKCHGTGQTPDGPCNHDISCPCPKCSRKRHNET